MSLSGPSTSSPSERTPLFAPAAAAAPSYVFNAGLMKRRQARVKQLQTCICVALLAIFGVALLITVSYSLEHDIEDNNTTVPIQGNLTLTPGSNAAPASQKTTILSLSWPRPDTSSPAWFLDEDSAEDVLEMADIAGAVALYQRTQFEMSATPLSPDTPAYRAQRASATGLRAVNLSRAGYAADHATKAITKSKSNPLDCCSGNGPKINASWLPPDYCNVDPLPCSASKYSSIDGTCNNRLHQTWGVALTPFRRALPPDYADGVSVPRRAVDGSDLPSAREVSLVVHRPTYDTDPQFTVMLAVWGQFLDHDITATALNKGINGAAISCCDAPAHPECFPVPIGPGDPNYDQYNTTCMEFVRSIAAPACHYGPRNQLNQATAFIDGSAVYSPDPQTAHALRDFSNGMLRVLRAPNGRELLPRSTDPDDGCNEDEQNSRGKYCFEAGDARANENLHLTTMHVVWTRHHNTLARQLHALNPHWDDERIYQESRRIAVAQIQHISYREFLPVLFGAAIMVSLDLQPREGYYESYDETVDPSIANHFAAAAFRFAHTLLPSLIKYVDTNENSLQNIQLHTMLFNPYSLYGEKGVDAAVMSALETPINKVDPHVSNELTSHLFERDITTANQTYPFEQKPRHSKHGLDLVSLNVQRGRDHGLPAYPHWRGHCGLSEPTTFDDLRGILDDGSLGKISKLYKSVDDVDLYTGALSEKPMPGHLLGPTLTCLLGDQFVRLRRGDRYWYETAEQPQAFTPGQLNEIKKTTLASIICKNGDSLKAVQREVMHSICAENPLVSCKDLQYIDLNLWKENNA